MARLSNPTIPLEGTESTGSSYTNSRGKTCRRVLSATVHIHRHPLTGRDQKTVKLAHENPFVVLSTQAKMKFTKHERIYAASSQRHLRKHVVLTPHPEYRDIPEINMFGSTTYCHKVKGSHKKNCKL